LRVSNPVITIVRRSGGREQRLEVRPWHVLGVLIAGALVQGAVALCGLALPVDLGVFETPRTRIERRIHEIDARLTASRRAEGEARRLAGLDPVSADVRRLGVGGAAPTAISDPLEEELHRLNLACELRRASYREITARLRARRELWEHIPLISPVADGYTSSRFGWRADPFTNERTLHLGLDMHADPGSPVYAAANGVVRTAGRQSGYGLVVILDHGNGLETRYAHAGELLVKAGDTVRRGQMIARVGSSGRVTAPHLHYEVRRGGEALDPARFLAAVPGELE